ncbi:MAG: hypothetical protein AB7F89_08935, partial [Pirellulaceae bacterium]
MNAPKPPPRILNADEERKVQKFLELAAPIVLESPALNADRWRRLAHLAGELELSANEFQSTLEDLLKRGVLQKIEVQPPKPPPLPARTERLSDSAAADLPQDEGFALAPPRHVVPPPRTIRLASEAVPAERPEAGTARPPPELSASVGSRQSNEPERAGAAPAGAEPAALPATASEARPPRWLPPVAAGGPAPARNDEEPGEVPVDAERADESWRREVPAAPPPPAELDSPSADGERSGRWRIEGEPVPIPPPPPKRPYQTFLDYVRQSCASVTGKIPVELEQRMLSHGVRLLGLSGIYARHLLLEMAAEQGLKLASGAVLPAQASRAAPVPSDPRLEAFRRSATPILALHRGINAQSRLLLMAVAREQGFDEAELDSAVSSLSAASASSVSAATVEPDPLQAERLPPFREQVRASLEKLPRGILAPQQFDRLMVAGVEAYGLDREAVQQVVREVAQQRKIAVIEPEQAEQYVADLVTELLGDDHWLAAAKRERVLQTGAQWGLMPGRIEEIMARRVAAQRAIRSREQATTRLALGAAGVAAVVVISLLGYVFTQGGRRDTVPDVSDVARIGRAAPVVPPADASRDDSWWGVHLAFAVDKARQAFPELRPTLQDIAHREPARREAAYRQLVDLLLRPERSDEDRRVLLEVLSGCLALDPQVDAIRPPLAELLELVPLPDGRLPDAERELSLIFWSVRTVTSAFSARSIPEARVQELAERLGFAVGTVIDTAQAPGQMERTALAALGDRLFRMLIAVAPTRGDQAARLHATVSQQALPYLDARKRDTLNAEFLAAVLSASAETWPTYESLVRATVTSPEPLAVLKLLDLYETTTNAELQAFLGNLLRERSEPSTDALTVQQVVERVRRALGVAIVAGADEDRKRLEREARKAIEQATAKADETDRLLDELVVLAHYSTLECAQAHHAAGDAAIEALRASGPKLAKALGTTGDETKADAEPEPEDASAALEPELRSAVGALLQKRMPPTVRLEAIGSLARLTVRLPDISPRYAAGIAAYLLANRSAGEQRGVIEHAAALGRWNQLLIAIADRMEEASLSRAQLHELLGAMLGRSVIAGDGKEWLSIARGEVWRQVLKQLGGDKPAADEQRGERARQ